MIKVITYGTYDLLHRGHIRLLERAKALGDYLVVGVTADDFDKKRGKINVQQSLMERIEAVRAVGIADEIIIEEYEGQKIDDIRRYDIDVFTVGSDWEGKFDYLNDYCRVVYLPRTEGISSSDLRANNRKLIIGIIGEPTYLMKFVRECRYVNGVEIACMYTSNLPVKGRRGSFLQGIDLVKQYSDMLKLVDAVYIVSHPTQHYEQIKLALTAGKHVLCEMPITVDRQQCEELFELADKQGVLLTGALKTAYSTAYDRFLLLVKSGQIGDVISVDATCTSQKEVSNIDQLQRFETWNSLCSWGPVAMLPIFQLLGTGFVKKHITSKVLSKDSCFDLFTKIDFFYPHAVASIKVGKGVKSEGELVVSGTNGYVYIPAPWWKTDYFEIRHEDMNDNKRYFYQLDGEGIRYEIVAFAKSIESGKPSTYIEKCTAVAISSVIGDFYSGNDVTIL